MSVGILVANLRPMRKGLGHHDWVIEDWVFLNGVRGMGHLKLIRGLGVHEPNTRTGSSRTGSSWTDTRTELIRGLGHLELRGMLDFRLAATFSVNETVREASIASLRTSSNSMAHWLSTALNANSANGYLTIGCSYCGLTVRCYASCDETVTTERARTDRWLSSNCSVKMSLRLTDWRGVVHRGEGRRTSMARARPGRRRCTSRFECDRDGETKKRGDVQPTTVDE